jgi:hypothetical protein
MLIAQGKFDICANKRKAGSQGRNGITDQMMNKGANPELIAAASVYPDVGRLRRRSCEIA